MLIININDTYKVEYSLILYILHADAFRHYFLFKHRYENHGQILHIQLYMLSIGVLFYYCVQILN